MLSYAIAGAVMLVVALTVLGTVLTHSLTKAATPELAPAPRVPHVGDMLVYMQSPNEPQQGGHADHPCVVMRVWSPDCVNVKVFFEGKPAEDRTSQTFSGRHVFWPDAWSGALGGPAT